MKRINIKKYIGCLSYFDERGFLNIIANAKVFQMSNDGIRKIEFIVMGKNKFGILISSNGASLSCFPLDFVKIVK